LITRFFACYTLGQQLLKLWRQGSSNAKKENAEVAK
jgi:hypothetical protein